MHVYVCIYVCCACVSKAKRGVPAHKLHMALCADADRRGIQQNGSWQDHLSILAPHSHSIEAGPVEAAHIGLRAQMHARTT
jgi:hypothetical protein